jgi:DNA primase
MRYLIEKRKLSLKTIKRFKLGYCENGNGYKALAKAKLLDTVELSGMFHPQSVETTPIELYNEMITFPVIYNGDVVHFSGRYVDDDWVTKDMFSAHKHRRGQFKHVFNQDVLDVEDRYIVIVESPIDAMTLDQNGFYSIATFGVNGVGEDVAAKLKSHSIYICYDNDSNNSGVRGAKRLAQMLAEFSIESRIVTLPKDGDKMDVNTFFQTNNDDDFAYWMEQSKRYKPEYKAKREYLQSKQMDIMKVVNKYIKTKRRVHRGYLCACPFHKESKPSLHIFTDKNEYFCYGCGKAGDTLQLLMRIEELHGNSLSFPQAIKYYNTL